MNSVISYVIEQELLKGHLVDLPGLGTLYVERKSATLSMDGASIMPPYDELVFCGCSPDDLELDCQEYFYSLLERSMQESVMNYGYENAKISYRQWLDGVRVLAIGDRLDIEGVCSLVLAQNGWELCSMDEGFGSLLLHPDAEQLSLVAHQEEAALEEFVEENLQDSQLDIPQEPVCGQSGVVENRVDSFINPEAPVHKQEINRAPVVAPRRHKEVVQRTSMGWVIVSLLLFLAAVAYLLYKFI